MPRTYRLAVLECDTPLDAVVKERGTYGTIFRNLFQRGLDQYRRDSHVADEVELVVTHSNMVDLGPLPDLKDVDGLVLTGSKHNSYDSDEWILRLVDYVKTAYETTSLPIVGICFGHQILARALGGRVSVNPKGWEVSVSEVDLTPRGAEIFGTKTLSLHQMHRDIVLELPPGAENLGSSPTCEFQGMCIGKRVVSLQSHPEFDGFIMNTILETRHNLRVFNDEVFGSGKSRADLHHDGDLATAAFWRFLLEGQ